MTDKSINLTEYLIEHGIRPSFQRIKILQYLIGNKDHPTVDDIYQAVAKEVSTLSKTTVYNTLTLFTQASIIKGLRASENEIRYDPDTADHGHFKCKKCSGIYDFAVNIDTLQSDALAGFQIHEKGIYFTGICPACMENKTNSKSEEETK